LQKYVFAEFYLADCECLIN